MAIFNNLRRKKNDDSSRAQSQRQTEEARRNGEAQRAEDVESRRETERRWYARLPILAIAALTTGVASLTGLLVAASLFVGPTPEDCQKCELAPGRGASAPGMQASPPAQSASAVRMSLSSRELFGYNSTTLRVVPGNAQRELDACVDPKVRHVKIVGHADCIGSDAFNQELSERRALAIKSYLTAKGVDAGRITIQGLGSTVARSEAASLCQDGSRTSDAMKARLGSYRRVEVVCEYEQPAAAST
jgi:OmpA-OmpF porin, OOP family